ncbi:MAG: hypothetical protein M3Y09_20245 [Actinomycetota bacterium]|nr:hypothetical protein [Actinomycetota bacterium]
MMNETESVVERTRAIAARVAAGFTADQELAGRLNDAGARLQRANDELWWGIHPDGLAHVYGEHPAVSDVAFAENRSEVLASDDPLREIQQVHWTIHRAFADYQSAAEERRVLAGEIGELVGELVQTLGEAGWGEQRAREVDVARLARGEISLL